MTLEKPDLSHCCPSRLMAAEKQRLSGNAPEDTEMDADTKRESFLLRYYWLRGLEKAKQASVYNSSKEEM